MGAELLYSLAAIGGFGNQCQIRFGTDQYGYALPYDIMIVNCKNPNWS